MSFRCSNCHKPQKPRTKPIRFHWWGQRRLRRYWNGWKFSDGWEIVKEFMLCWKCAKKWRREDEAYRLEYDQADKALKEALYA